MKLIKSAIVYKAQIPVDPTTLHNHLAERSFRPPMQLQARSVGFVPPTDGCRLVAEFGGGLAFSVRIDDKVVPGSTVETRLKERIAQIQAAGHKVGRKQRRELRDEIYTVLLSQALTKTTAIITCFYEASSGFLIVATTSKKLADICVSQLVHAVGSVKTETIHVSDVKHGLTTRLKKWLDSGDDEVFAGFHPCDEAALALEKRKVSVRMGGLQAAQSGLQEALAAGFVVTSLGFALADIEFRLTADFHLKSIAFAAEPDPDEADAFAFCVTAALQVPLVSEVVSRLCELLSYKGGSEEQAAEAGEVAA